MKNLRIIEYSRGFQVKMYWYSDEFLLGYYLSDEDKEKRERRKRIKEELERASWSTSHFTEIDMDWDEIWEQEGSGLPTTSLPASEHQCEPLCEPGEGPSAAFFLLFTKCSELCSLGDHF